MTMNSYSKIKTTGSPNSRYVDSSDLSLAVPEPTKPSSNTSLELQDIDQIQNPEDKNDKDINDIQDASSVMEDSEQRINEERFGSKLRRNSSVSAASTLNFGVKNAFSLRRSSSVSEKYCRIYDRSETLASPIQDGDESLDTVETSKTRSVKKKHSRSRILKACKKFFGL